MRSTRLDPPVRGGLSLVRSGLSLVCRAFVPVRRACARVRGACARVRGACARVRGACAPVRSGLSLVRSTFALVDSSCALVGSSLSLVRSELRLLRDVLPLVHSACAMACIGAAATLSSRAVLLGRALFYLLVMTILSMFWDAVATEHASGALRLPSGIVLYVGVVEWIVLSVPAIHLRLEDDIRSGAIEAHLLRPMPYLLGRIGETLGGMAVRLGVLGLGGIVSMLASSRPGATATAWPLVVVLALLGGTVQVMLAAIAGLSTFWVRRSLAAYLIMQKLTFLLGGLFAPVTLYPVWLARIAAFSPFAASLYWPAVIVLQHDATTVVTAFAAVLAWIAILALLCACIWRAGMRRLLTRGV
jgi:ABC-2 type transport system permease protein